MSAGDADSLATKRHRAGQAPAVLDPGHVAATRHWAGFYHARGYQPLPSRPPRADAVERKRPMLRFARWWEGGGPDPDWLWNPFPTTHHAAAESYRAIYRHLDPDWHLGVTATPDRFDGENLGQVSQSVAFEYSLRQAIRSGFLARLRVVRCETDVDLREIRTTGGDLNQGDVEAAIAPRIEELVNATTRQKILLDFAWLSRGHRLVAATELFVTTGADSETQGIAEELIAKGETDDLMLALGRAEEVRVERQSLRIKVRERQARYRRVSYDPMAVMGVLGMASRPESDSALRTKATEKQIATLEKFGVSGAGEMSRSRASLMLDRVFGRMHQGLATVKQVSHLIARGVDPAEARAISKDEASERLDVLFGMLRSG